MKSEDIINYFVVFNKPGRKFTSENDTRWGGLIEPEPLDVLPKRQSDICF